MLIKCFYKKYAPWGVQMVSPVTVYTKGEIIMLLAETKSRIIELRLRGVGYAAIAKKLSMTPAAVRMYCIRHSLTDEDIQDNSVCVQCGKTIDQPDKGGRKIFCSEKCRSAWRRANHRLTETSYHHTCQGCGTVFETVGNKNQMYCSLRCYHSHRKGGAA